MKKNKKTQLTQLEKISVKTNNAIAVIKNTIDELRDANNDIELEFASNEAKINLLQNDNNALDQMKTSNQKIISNFEVLLGIGE